jgi:hypothetical protein
MIDGVQYTLEASDNCKTVLAASAKSIINSNGN